MLNKYHEKIVKSLKEIGLFVVCGSKDPNLFSTHWLATGWLWNKPVVIVAVRRNKLSREIIDVAGEFCVCVPYKDLRNEIMRADHLSGRLHNKFEELNLHPVRARKVKSYIIGDCGLHLECRVLLKTELTPDLIEPEFFAEMYSEKELHSLYVAEILEIYET